MKAMLKIGVSFMFVLSLLGCQTTGGPSDETLLTELLNSVRDSLMAQDIDGLVALYSENYSDSQGANKAAVREGLAGIKASGFLEGLEISLENVELVVNDDGTATATQVQFVGSGSAPTQTYTFVKEEGSWLVLSAETQGF
jgi:hypothetical protein